MVSHSALLGLLLLLCTCCKAEEDCSHIRDARAKLIADIVPAGVKPPSGVVGSSRPRDFTVLSNTLYFSADTSSSMASPWTLASLNDTQTPTPLVFPGGESGSASHFARLGDKTVLVGDGGAFEIVSADANLTRIPQVSAEGTNLNLGRYVEFRDELFWLERSRVLELWKTDGLSVQKAVDFSQVDIRQVSLELTVANNQDYMIFLAESGGTGVTDFERRLLVTDGMSPPRMVPLPEDYRLVDASRSRIANRGKLIMHVQRRIQGSDLYKVVATDLFSLDSVSLLSDDTCRFMDFLPLSSQTLLVTSECGALWTTDGTIEGTIKIHETLCEEIACARYAKSANFKGNLYFSGLKGGVYVTNGTSPSLLMDIPVQSQIKNIFASVEEDLLYIVVTKPLTVVSGEAQLWVSRGDPDTTCLQTISWPENDDVDELSLATGLFPFSDGLVFTTDFGKTIYNIEPRAIQFSERESSPTESSSAAASLFVPTYLRGLASLLFIML